MSEPMLELRAVSKSFGAVRVLHDVDFVAGAGQVTALVGDNGAGKSTLIKCIGGIHPFDQGEMLFEGSHVAVHSPKEASALGIEIVYQDLALCDNLNIVQNMFLGREDRGALRLLDDSGMEIAAERTLRDLGVTTVRSMNTPVARLSGGQRQAVAVAKAVMWKSKLAILDEPTAALGVAQTAQVLALVRRLSENGLGVILVSHNLNDVFAVADVISVLRLGRMVATVRVADVTSQEVVELITTGSSSRRVAVAPADEGNGR
jgi:D-xylose transport system ATP-binding protein